MYGASREWRGKCQKTPASLTTQLLFGCIIGKLLEGKQLSDEFAAQILCRF